MVNLFNPYNAVAVFGTAKRYIRPNVKKVPNKRNDQIIGIQYLRGLAALMVVFTHVGGTATIPKYFGLNLFHGAYQGGGSGVQLFFVISGFIMVYVSLSKETLDKKITPLKFLKRRFVRIIPFMWLCVIGHALLMFLGREMNEFPLLAYLRSLSLFPVGDVLPNVIWTLRHEFLFYLVFCLTVLLLNNKSFLLFLWVVSPLIWNPIANNVFANQPVLIETGNFLFSSYNLLFGIGLAIGLLVLKGKPSYCWTTGKGFLICFLFTLVLLASANHFSYYYTDKLLYNSILGAISGLIIFVAISMNSVKPIGRLNKIGLLLGNASYSIYLTHSAIISCIFGIWVRFQKSPNPVVLVIVTVLVCCIGGILAHQIVEKPLLKFLQNRIDKRGPKQAFIVK